MALGIYKKMSVPTIFFFIVLVICQKLLQTNLTKFYLLPLQDLKFPKCLTNI